MKEINVNDVKKELYKEKRIAYLISKQDGIFTYVADSSNYHLVFRVPVSDMGEKEFGSTLAAQLLIRYLTDYSYMGCRNADPINDRLKFVLTKVSTELFSDSEVALIIEALDNEYKRLAEEFNKECNKS